MPHITLAVLATLALGVSTSAQTATKVPLPIKKVTPGKTDSRVTPGTVATTICGPPVNGLSWAKRARKKLTNADGVKKNLLRHQYKKLPGTAKDYELDHLIPLELGGNPTDVHNLWPEPWEKRGAHKNAAGFAKFGDGAQSKDYFEDYLKAKVCNTTPPLSITTAWHEIRGNWHASVHGWSRRNSDASSYNREAGLRQRLPHDRPPWQLQYSSVSRQPRSSQLSLQEGPKPTDRRRCQRDHRFASLAQAEIATWSSKSEYWNARQR